MGGEASRGIGVQVKSFLLLLIMRVWVMVLILELVEAVSSSVSIPVISLWRCRETGTLQRGSH